MYIGTWDFHYNVYFTEQIHVDSWWTKGIKGKVQESNGAFTKVGISCTLIHCRHNTESEIMRKN